MNRLGAVAPQLMFCLVASTVCVATSPVCFAAKPWPRPVGRATSDRDADLIAALVRTGRFEDALGICGLQLRGADPRGDTAAKWTIRQSQILAARQMASDRFDESDIQAAKQPSTTLLDAYPEHRRGRFLEADLAVDRDAALHSVMRAAVSPTGDVARESALKLLLRTTTALELLADRVGDARSQLESQAGVRDFGMIADLVRLQQELQVDAVSLAVMQTELFSPGSDDRIAAATKAEQAADDAIAKLPSDTPARLEVERLKVEAILRADQLRRAANELDELIRATGGPPPPRVQAMQVRLDVASRRMAEAGARLIAFYGEAPENAPPSIEMDLARLEFLLRSDGGKGVGAWLDVVEKRGGGYARRRAEVISLASLRRQDPNSDSNRDSPMVDPSLVAAQGQDWLRRGNPGRAGELLSAAAAAETDSNRAIERAGEAAAALVSAGRARDAAQVLADISLAKPEGARAAAAHLQAMVMISSSKDNGLAAQLETMLRANLGRWPSGETAVASRQWLQKLLIGQNRDVEAAEVATNLPLDEINIESVRAMIDLWRAAFRSRDDESLADLSDRFQASFRPLLESELVRAPYRLGAALLLDRDALFDLPGHGSDDMAARFADALLDFRERGVVSDVLRTAPTEYIDDATWRLMRDGRSQPKMRQPIALLLARWQPSADASLQRAERLLWVGETEEAVSMLRELIRKAPTSAEITKRAASLLGSSSDARSRVEAIKLWDELAAGTKKGSGTWHEAKLASIGLLGQSGKKAEAQRRAKYILLTMPSIDEELKRQYQSASQ